jgi:hypothetical protein
LFLLLFAHFDELLQFKTPAYFDCYVQYAYVTGIRVGSRG